MSALDRLELQFHSQSRGIFMMSHSRKRDSGSSYEAGLTLCDTVTNLAGC